MKFWIEDPKALFQNIDQVLPLSNMSLEEQMNCLTRLSIIMFIIMLLINFDYSVHFLIISLVLIIIIYYKKKEMSKENYEAKMLNGRPVSAIKYDLNDLSKTTLKKENGVTYLESTIPTGEYNKYYNDAVSIDPQNNCSVGLNQRLATPTDKYGNVISEHPVTKIKPVILPPIYDLTYWRDNELIDFSILNRKGAQQDMYLSGYAESVCCDYLPPGTQIEPQLPKIAKKYKNTTENYDYIKPKKTPQNYYPEKGRSIKEPYEDHEKNCVQTYPRKGRSIKSPTPVEDIPFIPSLDVQESYEDHEKNCVQTYPRKGRSIKSPTPVEDIPFIPSLDIREGYTNTEPLRENRSGWINEQCGYNPSQLETAGLPTNLPSGTCEQDPVFKRYNENLFTQNIGPGVYTRNQIDEPINSNIGISFQQQFEPLTSEYTDKGLMYTQHDPRIMDVDNMPRYERDINPIQYDTVYDPRFYGYGSSYRSYNEPITGQPRFYYDDVNSIRMPNYITRSKVDFLPYTDRYGPMQEQAEFGNPLTNNMRTLVQDSFLRDSLQFRNDLSERRMRKINSEAWQRRQFPINTMKQ